MLIFFIICALLVLLALWFVLPELLQQTANGNSEERGTANLLVYQDQFQEMEADLKNGLVSEEQYQQDKEELERRLLEDVSSPSSDFSSSPATTRKVAYGIGMAIPIGVIALYFVIGNPKALDPSLPQMTSPATQPGG